MPRHEMRFLMSWGAFLIILLFSCSHLGISFTPVAGLCLQDQKDLLLELRNNLTYNSSLSTKLVRWDEFIDCCQWDGVKCDAKGRVSGLDLSRESISGGINDASSSLFGLVFLQSLNLSQNRLDSVEFPSGFGKLKELNYLNLSCSNFSGQIPLDLSNLTRLVVLDLSTSWRYSSVRLENPDLKGLIHKLTRLRELYLDSVNISARGYNWCNALSSSLPHLRVLSLSDTFLTDPFDSSLLQLQSLSIIHLDDNNFSSPFPGFFADFPKLKILTMFSCNLSGVAPVKLFLIKSLQTIDLSFNENLECSLPDEFPLDGSLQSLDLSYTKFSGNVPESVGSLRMLSHLSLRRCNFSGPIPSSFKNLRQLVHLDLSYNQLVGSVPAYLFVLPSLTSLDLSSNSFCGLIRDLKNVSSSPLQHLDLRINNLEGPIPQFLFVLQNLWTLDLSSNKFNGSVELTDFQKLTGLIHLDLSRNNLSVHIGEKVSLSSLLPNLEGLMLASCKLQNISLLKNHSSLRFLDLSDNQLQGEIPNYIWEIGDGYLRGLNLSHNQFTHLQEPYVLRSLEVLDLHSNMLRGQIPILPPSTYFIDLSSNYFSSCLPSDISDTVWFLNLKRNNLSGKIPYTFPVDCNLGVLDLSYNAFQGKVPRSLERCTWLRALNLGNNDLSDPFPCWLKNLTELRVLVLGFNKFHGNISCLRDSNRWENLRIIDLASNSFSGVIPTNFFPKLKALMVDEGRTPGLQLNLVFRNSDGTVNIVYNFKISVVATFKGRESELQQLILALFSSIDFSNNHFEGIIPETIGELKALYVLNFSHNALSGHIPASMGNLPNLGSLDLSSNNMVGKIPSQLTNLTLLSVLNLSYNQLVGRIPQGGQMLTFPDGYLGNEGLCGLPLSKTCSDDFHAPASPQASKSCCRDDVGLYASAESGFFVGLAILFWPLAFSGRWRRCYNRILDKLILWVLRRWAKQGIGDIILKATST